MKYIIISLFLINSLISQFSNFSKKTYYHNLNNDISYSYVFIVDKNKINTDKVSSVIEVMNLNDSIVYRHIGELDIPKESDQNLFAIEQTLAINLLNESYVLKHSVKYGSDETVLNTEDIVFEESNTSELYLFSAKSDKAVHNYVEINGQYFKANHDSKYRIGLNNAMYWYIEFYDLELASDTVQIEYGIYAENGDVLKTFSSVFISDANTFYDDGVYNVIAKLSSGKYRLSLRLKVNPTKVITKNAYFEVIKEKAASNNIDYVKYEVDHYFVLYKLESDEKSFYLKLGKEKQIEFIAAYFNKLKKVENISIEQIRRNIDEMANFIDLNYGNQSLNPYRLDVCLLLFKYGVPSNIDRVNSDPELLDYEIWEYDQLKSGVKFYLSNYRNHGITIIHCSDPNFGYTNNNWKRLIRKI